MLRDGWAKVGLVPAADAVEALRLYLRRVGGPADLVETSGRCAHMATSAPPQWRHLVCGPVGFCRCVNDQGDLFAVVEE